MSELPDEPLLITQDAVGLYLWSIADTFSLLPPDMQTLLLRGIQVRLALLTLRTEDMSGDDATSLRQLHEVFLAGIQDADARRKET
jgi:hypothetical protein